MDAKGKTMLGIGIFALAMIGAVAAYQGLSARYQPNDRLSIIGAQEEETKNSLSEEAQGTEQGKETEAQKETAQQDGAQESEAAPQKVEAVDFTAWNAEGEEVRLSDYYGTPIVLNFWASWCPPCKSEMAHFNKVSEELEGEVTFLMVDMVDGQQETKEKGEQFIADSGYTFPVLYDVNQEAAYSYGVSSLPTTYFVDQEGYIVAGAKGAIDETTLRSGIALIAETQE